MFFDVVSLEFSFSFSGGLQRVVLLFELDFKTYMFENVSYPRIQTPTGCGRVLLQEPGIRCCPEIAEVALELEDLGLPARTPAGRNARSLGGFGAEFLGGLGDFGGVH